MKTKLITKIRSLVNTEETNNMEKEVEEIEKCKDDSSRMFKAIKDLNKMKPKTQSTIQKKEINIQLKTKKKKV